MYWKALHSTDPARKNINGHAILQVVAGSIEGRLTYRKIFHEHFQCLWYLHPLPLLVHGEHVVLETAQRLKQTGILEEFGQDPVPLRSIFSLLLCDYNRLQVVRLYLRILERLGRYGARGVCVRLVRELVPRRVRRCSGSGMQRPICVRLVYRERINVSVVILLGLRRVRCRWMPARRRCWLSSRHCACQTPSCPSKTRDVKRDVVIALLSRI